MTALGPALRQAVDAVLRAGMAAMLERERSALAERFVSSGMDAAGPIPLGADAAAAEVAAARRRLAWARDRLAEASGPGAPDAVVDDEWSSLHTAMLEGEAELRTASGSGVVGFGLARRRRGGVPADEPCIAVYVARKRTAAALARARIAPLPTTLRAPGGGAVPVDVVEVGTLRRFAVCGTGVGPADSAVQARFATLGLLARDRASGRPVVLTAGHLADGLGGNARFLAPQAGVAGSRPLGELLGKVMVDVDAAKIGLDDPALVEPLIRGIGVPQGSRALSIPGDLPAAVQLCGARSGPIPGVIVDAMVQLPGENLRNLFLVRASARRGDSGAAVFDLQRRVLGLLVGGFSSDSQLHAVCPIGAVLRALDCEL
jgi:hypothetical protein